MLPEAIILYGFRTRPRKTLEKQVDKNVVDDLLEKSCVVPHSTMDKKIGNALFDLFENVTNKVNVPNNKSKHVNGTEKNNELLIKSHETHPTGSKAFLEVNANTVEYHGHGRDSNRSYGCDNGHGYGRNPKQGHGNSRNPGRDRERSFKRGRGYSIE
ncbi:hypothetical protein Dsin_024611 [Dipteronia sinensis]|uniref:Uncharacterized protein n=1 Tax=Dipteronia sinensis TaxID=43782 RepID=A0AAD9ZUI1_9ROSI|nr:hypothetical protein Dsin_024611 [Dipteronia sinensis]